MKGMEYIYDLANYIIYNAIG